MTPSTNRPSSRSAPPARLPIDEILPSVLTGLRVGNSLVIQAPPGAGKTTRVAPALLDEQWLTGGRILLLEPRRLAVRAAARRIAMELGEGVGGTVGYRIRNDSVVGSTTRIEVITEGILTRMIQDDPALDGVGVVIFDEFHERSVHADLGLAFSLQARETLRPDLRIVVMSATLDAAPVADLLGGAPLVTSHGHAFPVETIYRGRERSLPLERSLAAAVLAALQGCKGDLLAFLPGSREIRRSAALLESHLPSDVDLFPLHGTLPQEEQDRAIERSREGRRKVVLATSIAETSLTIEGITIVVDSGLMRRPRFSPRSGMTRLETLPVSLASADQRRGRAGRTAPGVCYRLWNESENLALPRWTAPEILEADLTPLALELALWGARSATELQWLTPPPVAPLERARELLRELGAIDAKGTVTRHGRAIAAPGVHPRLAQMIVRGNELGLGGIACDIAAILEERDLLQGDAALDADLRLRIDLLRRSGPRHDRNAPEIGNAGALRRARENARRLRSSLGIIDSGSASDAGALLALAYPDRIAAARSEGNGRFLLRNGRPARLASMQLLSRERFLAVADAGGSWGEDRIFLAAPLTLHEIEESAGDQIVELRDVWWDSEGGRVRAERRCRLGAILLSEEQIAAPGAEEISRAVIAGVREEGLGALRWNRATRSLVERSALLRRVDPEWPDVGEEQLLRSLSDWLLPWIEGVRRREDLARIDLHAALCGLIGWQRLPRLDELAPTHLVVPSGSRIPIDYSNPDAPVLSVRLQEMFGATETPLIAGGRIPLTIHLLSPAGRPVQITRDLASFWREAYFDVRKDLRGRYPRHHWPENPLEAMPTRRVKRR